MPEYNLIPVTCTFCGRLISVASTPWDVPDEAMHRKCAGLRMLTQVVPVWPRDLDHGETVRRLAHAFPDWDWDAAWGSGGLDTWPLRLEPRLDGGGTENARIDGQQVPLRQRTQLRPPIPAEKPMKGYQLSCVSCDYSKRIYRSADILGAVVNHRGRFPGHRLTYVALGGKTGAEAARRSIRAGLVARAVGSRPA